MSKEIIQFDQAMFESKLDAMVREKVTKVPKLKGALFESAVIERYRRRGESVEEALIGMYPAGVVHQAGRRHRPVAVGRPHAVPDIERQAQARVRRDRRVAPERLRTTTYPHMHLYIIPLFSIKKRPIHNKSIISHRPMHYIVFILLLTMMLNSADKDIYIFSNRKHLQHTYHHGNSNSNNIPIWSLQPNDHSLNRQKHCCRNNQ